jgi:hypothetical protein
VIAKVYPLSLVIRAIDRATGPLKAITESLNTFTKPVNKFRKDWGKFSESAGFARLGAAAGGFSGALRNIGGEAVGLGFKISAMSGVAVAALVTIGRGAVDAGDELAEFSQRAGVTVDWFASMRHAAAQADVSQEDFNGAIDKFNKNLGDISAGKGGAFLKFLEKVSPALAKEIKGAKGTEAAFSIMIDAFTRVKDPAKRAALSAAAFGKSSLQMGQFLGQGSAAIQAQMVEYMRLSGSQEEFANRSSDLDNALRETETAFLGLRSAAGGALFPAVTQLSKAVTGFLVQNRDGLKKWAEGAALAIQKWIDGGGIPRLVDGVGRLATNVGKAVDFLGGFKGVAIAAALVMSGPLLGAIAALVPAVYGLGVALLTTPVGWLALGLGAVAGAIYLVTFRWKETKAFLDDFVPVAGKQIDDWRNGIMALVKVVRILRGELSIGDLVDWDKRPLTAAEKRLGPDAGPLDRFMAWNNTSAGPTGEKPIVERMVEGAPGLWERFKAWNDMRPTPAAVGAKGGESKVKIEIAGAPRGTRVTQDPNSSQPVDLSVGYSMAAPL